MRVGTRRGLLATIAATTITPAVLAQAQSSNQAGDRDALTQRVLANFDGLPGTLAVKFWAPATETQPDLLISRNSAQRLFIGSSIKAFVLCERLRQLDSPDVRAAITSNQLVLDASVWSPNSASFNPPYLTGNVTERTAMEAMILHSDNTATDMELKATGPDNVRAFLANIDLRNSAVPDSTRSFVGYLLGASDYKTFSWAELLAAADKPMVNSPLNDVETLASSADDLVSFYERSVQGKFFQHAETLQQYRNILSLGDIINAALPLGVSGFAKGGSIDVEGFHALSAPGAMYFSNRWVYFSLIINWYAKAEADPETVGRYLAASRNAFAQVYEALS